MRLRHDPLLNTTVVIGPRLLNLLRPRRQGERCCVSWTASVLVHQDAIVPPADRDDIQIAIPVDVGEIAARL
jgi:hypothetical protein